MRLEPHFLRGWVNFISKHVLTLCGLFFFSPLRLEDSILKGPGEQRDYTATRLKKGNPPVFPGSLDLHHFHCFFRRGGHFLNGFHLFILSPGAYACRGGGVGEDASCWHKFGMCHVISGGRLI